MPQQATQAYFYSRTPVSGMADAKHQAHTPQCTRS